MMGANSMGRWCNSATIPPQLLLAPVDAYGRCRMDLSYALLGSRRSPVVQRASFRTGLFLPAAARWSKLTWQSSGHLITHLHFLDAGLAAPVQQHACPALTDVCRVWRRAGRFSGARRHQR